MRDDANETYLKINPFSIDYLPRCEMINCSKKQFFEYLSGYEYFIRKYKCHCLIKNKKFCFILFVDIQPKKLL